MPELRKAIYIISLKISLVLGAWPNSHRFFTENQEALQIPWKPQGSLNENRNQVVPPFQKNSETRATTMAYKDYYQFQSQKHLLSPPLFYESSSSSDSQPIHGSRKFSAFNGGVSGKDYNDYYQFQSQGGLTTLPLFPDSSSSSKSLETHSTKRAPAFEGSITEKYPLQYQGHPVTLPLFPDSSPNLEILEPQIRKKGSVNKGSITEKDQDEHYKFPSQGPPIALQLFPESSSTLESQELHKLEQASALKTSVVQKQKSHFTPLAHDTPVTKALGIKFLGSEVLSIQPIQWDTSRYSHSLAQKGKGHLDSTSRNPKNLQPKILDFGFRARKEIHNSEESKKRKALAEISEKIQITPKNTKVMDLSKSGEIKRRMRFLHKSWLNNFEESLIKRYQSLEYYAWMAIMPDCVKENASKQKWISMIVEKGSNIKFLQKGHQAEMLANPHRQHPLPLQTSLEELGQGLWNLNARIHQRFSIELGDETFKKGQKALGAWVCEKLELLDHSQPETYSRTGVLRQKDFLDVVFTRVTEEPRWIVLLRQVGCKINSETPVSERKALGIAGLIKILATYYESTNEDKWNLYFNCDTVFRMFLGDIHKRIINSSLMTSFPSFLPWKDNMNVPTEDQMRAIKCFVNNIKWFSFEDLVKPYVENPIPSTKI
ncbi:hypothetical protein O181_044083 [Austropuccinia psidii MF-1]|uniref:Uncharacterized protein n=1 Tax=Austropuccinia psidii MF-1 TaxID=1389203 RepID=A0A9Q3HGB5_9BASI|nr:hypothetical protein [Austropuccinia psidii MF-1]